MKKTLSVILSLIVICTACLASCSQKQTDSTSGATVNVKIVNALEDQVILDTLVDYEDGMTVLSATIIACAKDGIPYEISESNSLVSLAGLVDFMQSPDAADENQWIYSLNGVDVYSQEDFSYDPGKNTVSAGDVIVWTFDALVEE